MPVAASQINEECGWGVKQKKSKITTDNFQYNGALRDCWLGVARYPVIFPKSQKVRFSLKIYHLLHVGN